MKKLFLNIAIIAGIVFFLDFVIGKVIRHFYFNAVTGLQYHLTYSMEKAKTDIVVFGGSRALYHYSPEAFEDSLHMTLYNTGTTGNSIFVQLAMLRSVLTRYTPKIIILDHKGSLGEGRSGYDEMWEMLPYYKTHKEIRKIVALRDPYERIKLFSEIYPFNSGIMEIMLNNMNFSKKMYPDDDGFIALEHEVQGEMDTIRNFEEYKIDTNKYKALKEFVNIAKNSGAKVFVTYSPLYEIDEYQPREITVMTSICANAGVPFWNFSNDSIFLTNRHLFADSWHLNERGASIFSRMVAHKIKRYIDSVSNYNSDIKKQVGVL